MNFIVTVPDKLIAKEIEGKEYIMASNEGEAISIGAGYWYATGKPADVYISADGFMNALNAITSLVIPEKIDMSLFISIGRTERQHYVATELVPKIIEQLKRYESNRISYHFITRQ